MKENELLTAEERLVLQQLTALDSLDGRRAAALLALDAGRTQKEAGERAGLTRGQVRYILARFRKQRLEGFEIIETTAPEETAGEGEAEAEPAVPPEEAKFQRILADLNQRARELQAQVPDYTPPAFSPQRFLRLLRAGANRFTPALVKDLRENLQDATAEDFKDPDTWKGIWFLLTYSLREESKSLFGKAADQASRLPVVGKGVQKGREALSSLPGVGEGVEKGKEFLSKMPGTERGKRILSSMPGAGLVSDVSGMLEGATPQDFLDRDTWAGLWYVINHSLQYEAETLKQRVLGAQEEPEEEVIAVQPDDDDHDDN